MAEQGCPICGAWRVESCICPKKKVQPDPNKDPIFLVEEEKAGCLESGFVWILLSFLGWAILFEICRHAGWLPF